MRDFRWNRSYRQNRYGSVQSSFINRNEWVRLANASENGVSKATNYSAGFSCSVARISWPAFVTDTNVSLSRIKSLTFPTQPIQYRSTQSSNITCTNCHKREISDYSSSISDFMPAELWFVNQEIYWLFPSHFHFLLIFSCSPSITYKSDISIGIIKVIKIIDFTKVLYYVINIYT